MSFRLAFPVLCSHANERIYLVFKRSKDVDFDRKSDDSIINKEQWQEVFSHFVWKPCCWSWESFVCSTVREQHPGDRDHFKNSKPEEPEYISDIWVICQWVIIQGTLAYDTQARLLMEASADFSDPRQGSGWHLSPRKAWAGLTRPAIRGKLEARTVSGDNDSRRWCPGLRQTPMLTRANQAWDNVRGRVKRRRDSCRLNVLETRPGPTHRPAPLRFWSLQRTPLSTCSPPSAIAPLPFRSWGSSPSPPVISPLHLWMLESGQSLLRLLFKACGSDLWLRLGCDTDWQSLSQPSSLTASSLVVTLALW